MKRDSVQHMYNEELKKKFISQYVEGAYNFYERMFRYSSPLEYSLGKDLYQFKIDEVETVLFQLAPPTLVTSRTNISVFRVYFDWAIKQGLTSVNPFDEYGSEEWMKKFIPTDIKLYVTANELVEIENYCVNAQDAVVYRLLFEGVYGKGCVELINLKEQDVDFARNILTLHDDNSSRKLSVSPRCIQLIRRALDEVEYQKKNGMANINRRQREYSVLEESDYVLRPSMTGNIGLCVTNMVITAHVKTINSFLGYEKLTPKNISRSGMFYMAKQIIDRKGDLDKEDYEAIGKRYGVSNLFLLKELVNSVTVQKLYANEE